MASFKQPGAAHSLSVCCSKGEARVCGQWPFDLMARCRKVHIAAFRLRLFLHLSDAECCEMLGLWEGLTDKTPPDTAQGVRRMDRGTDTVGFICGFWGRVHVLCLLLLSLRNRSVGSMARRGGCCSDLGSSLGTPKPAVGGVRVGERPHDREHLTVGRGGPVSTGPAGKVKAVAETTGPATRLRIFAPICALLRVSLTLDSPLSGDLVDSGTHLVTGKKDTFPPGADWKTNPEKLGSWDNLGHVYILG